MAYREILFRNLYTNHSFFFIMWYRIENRDKEEKIKRRDRAEDKNRKLLQE